MPQKKSASRQGFQLSSNSATNSTIRVRTRVRAFTLIELLVVIVIIGILATISVAQFNSYQEKTRNVHTIKLVGDYLKGLKLYQAVNAGAVLSFTGQLCLGSGYPDGECGNIEGSLITPTTENSTFNEELLLHVGHQQPILYEYDVDATDGATKRRGAKIFKSNILTVDGEFASYAVSYNLYGKNQDCGHRPLLQGTWPNMNTGNYINTGGTTGASPVTLCMVPIMYQ